MVRSLEATYFHLLALRLLPGRLAVFVGAGSSFSRVSYKRREKHIRLLKADGSLRALLQQRTQPISCCSSRLRRKGTAESALTIQMNTGGQGIVYIARSTFLTHEGSVGRFFTNPRSHACHGKVETKMQHGPLLWDSRGPSL